MQISRDGWMKRYRRMVSSTVIGSSLSPVMKAAAFGFLFVGTACSAAWAQQYGSGSGNWFAGTANGNGVFTLANATDALNVNVVLSDQTGTFTSGWNGRDLTKRGAGTLTLSAANTYTGATTVEAGTLALSGAGSIATSSGVTVNGGATFDISAVTGTGTTIKALLGSGTVTLGGKTLTLSAASGTFSGVIGGTGGLTIAGGTQTLTGANTYSGTTTIGTGAVLNVGNGGTSGQIAGYAGASFDNIVDWLTDPRVTGTVDTGENATADALVFNRSDSVAYSLNFRGNGGYTVTGGGTLALIVQSGEVNWVKVTGGSTLEIVDGQPLGYGTPSNGGNTLDNGTLRLRGIPGDSSHLIMATAKTITVGAGGGTIDANSAGIVLGGLSGSGALKVQGAYELLLATRRAKPYTGDMTIDGGHVRVDVNGSLPGDGNGHYASITLINGGTLRVGAATNIFQSIVSVVSLRSLVNNGGTVTNAGVLQTFNGGTINNMVGTLTNSGTLSAAGGIINAGTFTQTGGTASGGLTNTGTVNVSGGAINGAIANNSGGSFTVTGTVTSDGAFTNARGATLSVNNGGTYTVAGLLTNSGTLTVAFGGHLTATAGGLINAGTLTVASGGRLDDDLNNSGTFTNNGTTNAAVASNSGTITNNSTWTGDVRANTGTIANNAGATWTGNASNSAGGTITNAGTWTGSLTNSGTVTNSRNAIWNGNATNNAGGTITNAGTWNGALTNTAGGSVVNTATGVWNGRVTGTLTVDNSGTFNGDGQVNGPFTNRAGSTLRIDGGHSLSGLTTLSNAGTVTIAAGGALSAQTITQTAGSTTNAGTVTATGTLTVSGGTFTNSGTLSAAGGITNAGTFTQTGGTASGGLTNSGTVNASGGAINGAIANNSGGSFTVSGTVTSDGAFSNARGATLSVNNGGSYTVAGTVTNDGLLTVNGTLSASLTTIGTSGRLGGNGTIVGNVVSNGTIAPGNSIGTLSVTGNVTFNKGSTYEVETSSDGRSDQIKASGTVTINGGRVSVLAGTGGGYSMLTTYTIVTGTGGRSGAFDGVATDLAFLTPTLSYDASSVYLRLVRNDRHFDDVGKTPNQRETGRGVESLGIDHPLYKAAVNRTAAQSRDAFDQLSGGIHASIRGALVEDSRFLREVANERVRAAFEDVATSGMPVLSYGADGRATPVPATTDQPAFWMRGLGAWVDTNGNGNAAGLERATGGVLIGADATVFEDWRFGLMAGYSHTSFKGKDRASKASSDNYHLGLYGGTHWGGLALRTGAAYSWHDLDSDRSVAFAGFSDRLKSDAKAGTAQVFGELGYGMQFEDIAVEPFVNLAYVNFDGGGFREKGGSAALAVSGGTLDTTYTTLGLRGSTEFALGGVTLKTRGMLGWRHAFGDVTPSVKERFPGGALFMVAGVPVTRDAAAVEAGIEVPLASPDATLDISYNGQFGSGLTDQSVRASFNMKF